MEGDDVKTEDKVVGDYPDSQMLGSLCQIRGTVATEECGL